MSKSRWHILYLYLNNTDEQYTLQETLICVYLYPFSYNTLARRPVYIFFSFLLKHSQLLFIVFIGTYLSFSVWHISILKKKTAEDLEILVETRDYTRCHISEERSVNFHHFKNLNSYTLTLNVRLTLKVNFLVFQMK